MKKAPIALAIASFLSSPVVAAENNTDIETIKIIGSTEEARQVAGSSALIDEEQMRVEVPTDINQLMKTLPGVYVLEEDGFGLRPNIGIRAANAGRVSKVTLLEDGVMMAPAPYSNPAAYYFPTTMRMSSIEVLKGAPLLRYGPQTTGGVLNLVSTPIPEQAVSGQVLAQWGEFSSNDIHAYVGGTQGAWGFLLETVQRESNGFKEIDRSNRDSGYDIQDYTAKLSFDQGPHHVLFKAQYSEEISNETYLGLTDADFAEASNRRYGISSIDQMDNSHNGFSLAYGFDVSDDIKLNAVAYRNEFKRDWFKLSGGGSLVSAANQGDLQAQGILDGTQDAQGLAYKHNSRAYESYGLELSAQWQLGAHALEFGGRDHTDEMDRFQPVEIFDQVNGSLVYQSTVSPSGGDNRIEGADATSLWITDNWQVNEALKVNLALRYEDVSSFRNQYSEAARTSTPAFRSNSSDEWLPGASFTYNLNDAWQVLAGVHKGFSPLGGGATENQEPETSINYEAGLRYQQQNTFVEAIAFYSDFSDTTQLCSIATPCDNGAESGTYVLGESVVQGLELQAQHTFAAGKFLIPVDIAYTYTQGEISKDNAVSGLMDGDRLNDIPEHTANVRISLDNNAGWINYLNFKYIDSMCVNVGCNNSSAAFDETESLFVTDAVSRYELNTQTSVYVKVENIFDQQAIVARTPDGARPNKPQTVWMGIDYKF
ncbi:Fe(3+) dicitrate transport protein [Idiomarina fontislapidosi]|uniref:TonB-dependent receptor n=1 Tax=Idiomarina fontislapidosi TaxID=263723 RepID=A0A432Y7V5_9GAMM|nr:TonB-dependent receptor [Idiomarina fontislapidosi]PYE32307.1 Fe(3+) dicitrate transport protein [Idiomarina fontislapidosi]RUO57012.1 TonB-dependent receptor [Idiomarina fontislapidosi]